MAFDQNGQVYLSWDFIFYQKNFLTIILEPQTWAKSWLVGLALRARWPQSKMRKPTPIITSSTKKQNSKFPKFFKSKLQDFPHFGGFDRVSSKAVEPVLKCQVPAPDPGI